MCVTDLYIDRYPSGREVEFRKLSICQYGYPGRPCPNHSTVENPPRKIQFGEPTSEQLLTTPIPIYPSTPPRSPGFSSHRLSGGSHRRLSLSPATSEERRPRAHRTHRKERIIIVDAPPTPRTPPQLFSQTFTAPSSPSNFPPRGRPIIVDERTIPHRAPSAGATRPIPIIRKRSVSRPADSWDSPRTSYTSFGRSLEAEDRERRRQESEEDRLRRQRMERIAAQDAEIRSRPAIPIRPILRQTQSQTTKDLTSMMGGLSLTRPADRAVFDATLERRRLEREAAYRQRAEKVEAEAQKQRLRERQMPKRRFSVGVGGRRHRVMYDDGVYRWE